jgi:hypothetical protein
LRSASLTGLETARGWGRLRALSAIVYFLKYVNKLIIIGNCLCSLETYLGELKGGVEQVPAATSFKAIDDGTAARECVGESACQIPKAV